MIVKNQGLHGSIKKTEEGFQINVSSVGYGNKELLQILTDLGLKKALEKFKVGEELQFEDSLFKD